jgi:replication initiation protein RepC
MDSHRRAAEKPVMESVDKWDVLNALSLIARDRGVSDRTIAVLQVLLSFHPERELSDGKPMVVFASNASLCQRAHGMPESTLRRHIAALVNAGLILRHDSPNGKRYARRGQGGQITRAFGFDLRPLLVMGHEIMAEAAQELVRRDRLKALREEVSLMLRDAVKLILFAQESGQGGHWDALDDRAALARRYLRRKLDEAQLIHMRDEMQGLLDDIRHRLGVEKPEDTQAEIPQESNELSGSPRQNERHYQSSKKEVPDKTPPELEMVLDTCPEIRPYLAHQCRNWDEFVRAVCTVAPMIGVDPVSWGRACKDMGPENAAATVAAIVQRIDQIANPGAYFRVLCQKAGQGEFTVMPMLNAIARMKNAAQDIRAA